MAKVVPVGGPDGMQPMNQVQMVQNCKIWEKVKSGNLHDITREDVQQLHFILSGNDTSVPPDEREIDVEDLQVLRTAIPELQLSEQDMEDFVADCDADGTGQLSAEELYQAITLGSLAQKIIMENLNTGNKAAKPNECTRQGLVDWMEHEHDTSSSLWSLPQTILLFTLYLISVDLHIDMETGFIMQDSVYTGVTGEGKPFLYAYVHDIPSFWDWMDTSFIGVHLKNDLDNFPYPGRLESYSQIIGGIQMTKTDIVPGECDQSESLQAVYDSINRGCATKTEPQTNSTFVLYHLSNDAIKDLFTELRNSLWMSLDTTEMTTTILFYNGYLGAYTFYQFTCYFGGLKENNRKDGLMHMKFSQESFKADPYYDPIHKGHLWLFLPDFILVGILIRMFVGELKEMLPALMNGLSGFIEYWDVWNVIDWMSMLLCFTCIIMWTVICITVGGTLQEQIAALPTSQLDEIISTNRSYFSLAQLHDAMDVKAYEEQVALIQDTASGIAKLHGDLRLVVFFNSVTLMLKFFKAFRANPRLNVVIMTIDYATVDLAHFIIVFFCVFLVFASMGNVMFGTVCVQFHTMLRSMSICWRVLMGEDISEDMELAGTHWSWLWVVSFQGLVLLIMLEMITAIIMDSYSAVCGGSQLTIWQQTSNAITTIRETRGFVDMWYMICEFNDPEEPAHPGSRISARSLRRAFEQDKMTKVNAEYLITKTQEWHKEKEGEKQIGLTEGLKIMGQIRTMVLKINSDAEKTKDMVNRLLKTKEEEEKEAIREEKEALRGAAGLGTSGHGSSGSPPAPPALTNGSYGSGAQGLNSFASGPPSLAITSNGMPGGDVNGYANSQLQPAGFTAPDLSIFINSSLPLAISDNATPGGGADGRTASPARASGTPERQSMSSETFGGFQDKGRSGKRSGLQEAQDAMGRLIEQMKTQHAEQSSMIESTYAMTQHIQIMSAQMLQVQSKMGAAGLQIQDMAKAAETRHKSFDERVATLERRVEKVYTTSQRLGETFHGLDFNEFMSLPGKIEKAISLEKKDVLETRANAHDEMLREIGQDRAELGKVADLLLGAESRRAGGLHDLINRMEDTCYGRDFADPKDHPLNRKFKRLREVVDRYFVQTSTELTTTRPMSSTSSAQASRSVSSVNATSRPVSSVQEVSRPVSSSLSAQARAAGVVEKWQQQLGSDPDADKPKSLESQLDTMAEQLEKLKSRYEEQSPALQLVWRMDMNLRSVNKSSLEAAAALPPPVVAPVANSRFAQMQSTRNPTRRMSRLVSKSSAASSKRNSVSEAGESIVRATTPLTPIPD